MQARLAHPWRLVVAYVLLVVPVAAQESGGQGKDDKKRQQPASELKPLPKLAAKDLPAATRTKPDPARSQYLKEAVYVRIDEHAKPSRGEAFTPTVRVLENHLKEYFRRAGHPVVDGPAAAVYRIEGQLEAGFVSTLEVLGRVAAWKYKGTVTLRVRDSAGVELERVEIPEVNEENVKSEDSAFVNLRRRLAKLLWDQLSLGGKVFTDAEVVRLLASLVLDPGAEEVVTAEDVTRRLADIGFRAVPYLLESLTDNRLVRLPSKYPGLSPENYDLLRVYHLADKTLEEIFQKVSRMSLAIQIGPENPESSKHRFAITLGWQNEWRRFCKPFADSPNAPPAKAGESPTSSATAPTSQKPAKDSGPPGR